VGKSLELLREAVPGISRVAVLWNPDNPVFQTQLLRGAQAAAAVLGVCTASKSLPPRAAS
jgi:putative ABC transport system substrate-binding protein